MSTDPTLTENTDSSALSSTPVELAAPQLVVAVDQADADYAPGETVGITASNVAVGGSVQFSVAHVNAGADGVVGTADDMLAHDLTGTVAPWTVTDGGAGDLDGLANGAIQTSWYVNADAVNQAFVLTAAGQTSGQVATTSFTDAGASAQLDDWTDGKAPDAIGGNENWGNGDLNAQNSHYFEGDSVPFRATFADLVVGQTYTITLSYDTTKAGKHGFDYLTTYNATLPTGHTASEANPDPTLGTAFTESGPHDTLAIPTDTKVTNGPNGSLGGGDDITQQAGVFTMWGGDLTTTSGYTVSGPYTGDSETSITLTFTATSPTAVLAWAGHIGSENDWGLGSGAFNIDGSPYHMALLPTDTLKVSKADHQMQSDVVLNPDLSIQKTVTSVTDTNGNHITDAGDVIHYNIHVANTGDVTLTGVTVTDPLTGAPAGQVASLAVGGSEDLTANYTLTQSDIDNHGSNAVDHTTDDKITNTATADSDQTGPKDSSVDTPITYAPDVSIDKTATIADGHADHAGDIVNYTVEVSNPGDVTLTNVDVTDSFEGLQALDLTNSNSFNPVTHTGNTFNDPNNNGTLDPGETWTYTYQHVVTQTELDTRGVDGDGSLDNTATVTTTAPDLGPLSDSASIPILLGPGVRTPGFWAQNTGQNNWTKFWDGIVDNEPKQAGTNGFASGELTYAVDSNHDGQINNSDSKGLLIGDFNRDGLIDNGEHGIFISLTDALTLLNASQKQQGDERYVLGRDDVATWLNYLAGNGIGDASDPNSPRHYIDDSVQWLDHTTGGDHTLSVATDLTPGTAVAASSATWQQPQFGLDLSAAAVHSGLDEYNNHGTILGVAYATTP